MKTLTMQRRVLICGVSCLALSATTAWAQDSEPDAVGTVEELVVTAQKREESIQSVPIAVSAFSGDTLEKAKIDGGPNLVLAIPNVNFSKGNFTGYNFQIRGVGSKLVAASGDAGTGVHLNNAPLVANNLFETEFYDVERVEVLRGPQGTLYGRNATGGVVNMITNKPVDFFEANARAEISNYDGRKFRGMVNLPMGEMFALRVAGSVLQRDGYGVNTVTGNDVDDRDLYGVRATLAFTPNDRFSATLMYDRFAEDDHRSRIGKQYCTKDTGPDSVGGASYSSNSAIATIQRGLFSQGCKATSVYDKDALGTVNSQATLGGLFATLTGMQTGDAYAGKMQDSNVRNIESAFDPIYRAHSNVWELNMEWELTDSLTLSSLTAYSDSYLYTRQDYNRYSPSVAFNSTPNPVNAFSSSLGSATYSALYSALFPGGTVSDPQNGAASQFTTSDISWGESEQVSQELRLQSSFDGPLNFNVGLLYLKYEVTDGDYYVMFNSGTAYFQLRNYLYTGNANCTSGANCVAIDPNKNPDRSGHNYYNSYAPYQLESKAVFGEVYWQPADEVKLTLGLRYTDDDKSSQNYAVVLGTTGSGTATPTKQHVSFGETTGRLGVDWSPDLFFTDQTLLYAFASRGYKGGGFNTPCTASAGVSCGPANFDPEFVNAIEIGAKNTLLDGRLVLNATAFAYDYQGYQVSKIVNRASTNENIDARIHGIELETIWAPTPALRFNSSLGWLETEITGGTSVDTFNRTQDDDNLVVVKSSAASNCVVRAADAAVALADSSSNNNPFALLDICTVTSTATAGTLLSSSGATAIGSNAAGALVSDGVAVDLKGNELPNAPHWTWSLGAQYSFQLPSGWDAVLRGDYYVQSGTFTRIYNSEADELDGWQNVNLTLTFNNQASGWSFDAFVKNATDEEAITDTYLTDDSSGLFRNAFYTEPRTFGIAVSKRW